MAKSSQAELRRRINIIFQLLLSEAPRTDIDNFCADEWGITSRQATRYIKSATKMIADEAAAIRKTAMEKQLVFRAFLKHRALKNGDNHLALKVAQDEAKLLNLYPAARSELSGPDGGPIQTTAADFAKLTDDELRAYIAIGKKLTTGGPDD